MQQVAPGVAPGAGAPGAASGEPEPLRNLMVNYIPTTIDETQLSQIFAMYGQVESVKIVKDRETRTSKGFGFVKYLNAFSAAHAIQFLNGYPLMNKRLKVAYANQAEAQRALAAGGIAGGAAAGGNPQAAAQQQMAAQQMMAMHAAMAQQQAGVAAGGDAGGQPQFQ